MLKPGDQLNFEISGSSGKVLKQIGEGGQGFAYTVALGNGSKTQVVKWYKKEFATQNQQDIVKRLVMQGPPPAVATRFIWPRDLVSMPGREGFGYLMEYVDTSRYAELPQIWAGVKPRPTILAMCEASRQAAESYRALHLTGRCYRDISMGNIMIDTASGDVVICDNDNVGVNNQTATKIQGTMEFMAPELILAKAHPSTDSDLHSLAVLFFMLWVWHHPLHGKKEYEIRCWDIPGKKKIYGEEPVFIFDPQDKSNELPRDPDYRIASDRWKICPPELQSLFIRAFTEGLHNPSKRVTEGEWMRLFGQMKNKIISCPKCRAEVLVNASVSQIGASCWNCSHSITGVQLFEIVNPSSREYLVVCPGLKISNAHLGKDGSNGAIPVAEVVPHPKDPKLLGLRNTGKSSWDITLPNGSSVELDPGKAMPLQKGLKVRIGDSVLTVQG